MKDRIDLNCDLGEYELLDQGASDTAIMPFISSCNIACGGHAGNREVMMQTVKLAQQHHVNIGAHPSFPDRENFGREVMVITDEELKSSLFKQITTLQHIALKAGGQLQHVKPHGALYNQAAIDMNLARLIAGVIAEVNHNQQQVMQFMGLAHSYMQIAAEEHDLPFMAEGFVDRAYTKHRTLLPRNLPGAMIVEVEQIPQRVVWLIQTGTIKTVDGGLIELDVDTLCLHGDHPQAVLIVEKLHKALTTAGIEVGG